MARELTLTNHPIIEPGVCGKCGTQISSWFVDLGFDTVFNYDDHNGLRTWCDGVVYLCAECCNSFFEDLFRAYNIYKRDNVGREITPLKMIPITLDKKEDSDGDSGSSSGNDLDESDESDPDDPGDESDDREADETFRVSFAKAV